MRRTKLTAFREMKRLDIAHNIDLAWQNILLRLSRE